MGMKYKITFNRDRYHLYPKMADWCEKNIGQCWSAEGIETKWDLKIAFGTTTYYFKHKEDYDWFRLRWE